jgi:hypothetical protein
MTRGGSRRKALRLAFVGWGAIARRAAGLLLERNSNITVVGVATKSSELTALSLVRLIEGKTRAIAI